MNDTIYAYYRECRQTLPVDETLVFLESHNGIDLAGNLFAIARILSTQPAYAHYRVHVCTLADNQAALSALCERYGMRTITFVIRESMDYARVLATAGHLISDVAYHPLFDKRPHQRCISTWHGTPLKTLGFSYMEDQYVAANQKRGFLLADIVAMPNVYTWECIERSYQLKGLFHGRVVYGGSPRNSVFFDGERRKQMRKALGVSDKQVVAYLPTWRGKVTAVDAQGQNAQLQQMLDELDMLIEARMGGDTIVWVKLHRLNQSALSLAHLRHIIPFPQGYDTYDVLNAADVLVTDYSSVLFDFACTRRRILLFCYDYRHYVKQRGCYFDPAKLPFPLCETIQALVDALARGKGQVSEAFCERFVSHDGVKSAQRLCAHLFAGKRLHEVAMPKEHRRKVLFFIGELHPCKESDALFFYLKETFGDDARYISYMNHLFLTHYERLWQFPEDCLLPMYRYQGYYAHFLPSERHALAKVRKAIAAGKTPDAKEERCLSAQGMREYRRYLYANTFDLFVRYGGLDIESLKWFAVYEGEKWLIVQENMLKKAMIHAEYAYFLKRAMRQASLIGYPNAAIAKQSVQELGTYSAPQRILYLYPDASGEM